MKLQPDIRFDCHFEPEQGWMNDPNGLCRFGGLYHAFFQYNPHAPHWDTMHWGHGVSEDLVRWRQVETALFPDRDYENEGGCFSGSALEVDGALHLFYTAVSRQLGQTQAMARSRDGLHFEKHPENPLIPRGPYCGADGWNRDFRDPKVFRAFGKYCMVVGTCREQEGQVVLFTSEDLYRWDYQGVLYGSDAWGGTLECPDLFPLGDKWVLMFSAMKPTVASTVFIPGTFDGNRFLPEGEEYCEFGPDFYAPQTFEDEDGQRILIGWFYHWGKELPEGAATAGALSIPRVLSFRDGYLHNYPVAAARHLLQPECPYVSVRGTTVTVTGLDGNVVLEQDVAGLNSLQTIEKTEILFDRKAVEIFLNGGQVTLSQWLI